MSVQRTAKCPICGKPVPPRQVNRAFPFCSDRCRLIDLGKWLGEEYRIAGPRLGDGSEASSEMSPPDAEEDEP